MFVCGQLDDRMGFLMRELYACQLDLEEVPGVDPVRQMVEEWVARGSGIDVEQLRPNEASHTVTALGHSVDCEVVPMGDADGQGWTCSWRRSDDRDLTLDWRLLLACGPLRDSTKVRFSIRIGLERSGGTFQVAPPRYMFGAPAIVRTLLRQHLMLDALVRVEPNYRVRRAADITPLTEFLLSTARQLPVLVLSRSTEPDHPVDAAQIAQQLAGLAHVEVLPSHLSAMLLADKLGTALAVRGGEARLYWPRFALSDRPQDHPLWSRAQLSAQRDFVARTRSWLGGLGAAAVPEHPAVVAARARQRTRVRESGEVPAWILEYIDESDTTLDTLKTENSGLREELATAQESVQELTEELSEVRRQFYVVRAGDGHPDAPEEFDLDQIGVKEAFALARQEADEHVVFLNDCERSVADFVGYQSPRRLYEALTAISDAAVAWQEGTLGQGFGAFFAARGYEYSKRNPAATARATKANYKRTYDGRQVLLEPHLKVDQASHPDQCLRIYWYVDDGAQKLVIGHVGRHLPD